MKRRRKRKRARMLKKRQDKGKIVKAKKCSWGKYYRIAGGKIIRSGYVFFTTI
jgi:hypothetical protein